MKCRMVRLAGGCYRLVWILTLAAGNVLALPLVVETPSVHSPLTIVPHSMLPHWKQGGIDVDLASGKTLTRSLLRVGDGVLDMAIAPPGAYTAMKKGKNPYRAIAHTAIKASRNVRSLFGVPGSYFLPLVWERNGIRRWEDIRGKNVYIGPPAGAANRQIRGMIENAGIRPEEYQGLKAAWGAAAKGFVDNQYDLYVGAYSVNSRGLAKLSARGAIRVLSLPPNTTPPEGLTQASVEPANLPGVANVARVNVWHSTMMMVVNKRMSDEVAYQLTRTFMEKRREVALGNDVLIGLESRDPFAGVNAPLHPGAYRYYQEAGIQVPEHLLPKRKTTRASAAESFRDFSH